MKTNLQRIINELKEEQDELELKIKNPHLWAAHHEKGRLEGRLNQINEILNKLEDFKKELIASKQESIEKMIKTESERDRPYLKGCLDTIREILKA